MGSKKTEFIVNDLISKIFQKRFPENKLPNQRDLAFYYNVSRYTVQKALLRLQGMGLIHSIQGDGIYIQEKALGNPLIYNSVTEIPYSELQSKILDLKKIKVTPELANIFNLEPEDEVWEFQRVRIVRYELNQVETGWLPCRLFPEVKKEDIEDSIQNMALEKKYKISHFMTRYKADVLDRQQAEILGRKKGTPAMNIVSRGILKDGTIFVHSKICALNYDCIYFTPFNKGVYLSRRKKHGAGKKSSI